MVKVIKGRDSVHLGVSLGVGPGRANNIDDVTLVQYMLNLWLQHPETALVKSNAGDRGKPLATDGIIGPKTKAQILLFQEDQKYSGFSFICDGRMDRYDSDFASKRIYYSMYLLHISVMALHGVPVHEMRYFPGFPKRILAMARRASQAA